MKEHTVNNSTKFWNQTIFLDIDEIANTYGSMLKNSEIQTIKLYNFDNTKQVKNKLINNSYF